MCGWPRRWLVALPWGSCGRADRTRIAGRAAAWPSTCRWPSRASPISSASPIDAMPDETVAAVRGFTAHGDVSLGAATPPDRATRRCT